MSNFQQVGNLQSQNTGVSHAAGTKGVYSSPLPDIFNPNSLTRTPSSVMNSSKKEETKAFDFISCSADQILMNEAPSKSTLYLMNLGTIGALERSE
ncbi:Protein MODIFIED TRANSPORT TO THE VACUOLE 1 [Camellia lanceoleosa]|uniref:Protein MODIFIED TRANSPORT TO THE VACUOLE 1 n=1 Tax=Camellia lanceoleosa TaxID=1840588 RepID=A0ACC0HAF7_9ERIC|nr:Protein MODIFIED TRANSPORT TO THE VACUOLE 1 [Camellia lanceoleosa]